MAKLVDAPDLGSGVARRVGSSPIRRTAFQQLPFRRLSKGEFCFLSPLQPKIAHEIAFAYPPMTRNTR